MKSLKEIIEQTRKEVAKAQVSNQEIRKDDYFVGDILYCGTCGEPRRTLALCGDEEIAVIRQCKCEKEAEEERMKLRKYEETSRTIKKLVADSMLDARFKDAVFSKCEVDRFNEKTLSMCRKYAKIFPEMERKNQGLLLWGNVGTGKTYATACIANFLMKHLVPVVCVSMVSILDMAKNQSVEEVVKTLTRGRLVIIDDLGSERYTDYALERIYGVIDGVYRKRVPMVITTNLSPMEMQNEADMKLRRIYDRVLESCYPIQFTGPSRRLVDAAAKYEKMERILTE